MPLSCRQLPTGPLPLCGAGGTELTIQDYGNASLSRNHNRCVLRPRKLPVGSHILPNDGFEYRQPVERNRPFLRRNRIIATQTAFVTAAGRSCHRPPARPSEIRLSPDPPERTAVAEGVRRGADRSRNSRPWLVEPDAEIPESTLQICRGTLTASEGLPRTARPPSTVPPSNAAGGTFPGSSRKYNRAAGWVDPI